jgi:hypothetical protein
VLVRVIDLIAALDPEIKHFAKDWVAAARKGDNLNSFPFIIVQ